HARRKHFIMAAFSREALVAYLPTLRGLVQQRLAGWSAAGELAWQPELKRLAVEAICVTVLGLEPGPIVDQVIAEYDRVTAGFTALPIPLPGSTYQRARRALRRILDIFEKNVRDHLAHPRDDGLSRILAARSPEGEA